MVGISCLVLDFCLVFFVFKNTRVKAAIAIAVFDMRIRIPNEKQEFDIFIFVNSPNGKQKNTYRAGFLCLLRRAVDTFQR